MLIVLVALLTGLIGFWIVTPLLLPPRANLPSAESSQGAPRVDLQERRDNVLRSLKDLDFDRSMEKISEEEYTSLRAGLSSQASILFDQLEYTGPQPPVAIAEQLVRQPDDRATGLVPGISPEAELELEVLVARRRRSGRWDCGRCGRSMSAADLFCASCGEPRQAGASPATARLH